MGMRDEFTVDIKEDMLYAKLGTFKGTHEKGECHLHFKAPKLTVGFLIYVSLTYTGMMPYLRGNTYQ